MAQGSVAVFSGFLNQKKKSRLGEKGEGTTGEGKPRESTDGTDTHKNGSQSFWVPQRQGQGGRNHVVKKNGVKVKTLVKGVTKKAYRYACRGKLTRIRNKGN